MNTFQNAEARQFGTFDATVNLVRGSNVIGMGHDKFSAVENALFGIKIAAQTQEGYKTERAELIAEIEKSEKFEDAYNEFVHFVDVEENEEA